MLMSYNAALGHSATFATQVLLYQTVHLQFDDANLGGF